MPVHNQKTGEPIGELVNLSSEGAMFVTPEPVRTTTLLHCRVDLPQRILGRAEIIFKALCLWSRKNVRAGCWESGYRLKLTGIDAELVSYLVLSFKLRDWGDANMPQVRTVELDTRRTTVRCEFDSPVPIFDLHSYRQIGDLADLSFGGLRLFALEPIDKGAVLACRVRLPRKVFQQEYLIFEAECMWCRGKQDGRYETGLRISTISKEDAAIILHMLVHSDRIQRTKMRLQVVK